MNTSPEQFALSRPQWMATTGRSIYGGWTLDMLKSCDNPTFWRDYQESLVSQNKGVRTGFVLGMDDGINQITVPPKYSIEGYDTKQQHRISNRYFKNREAEITHYTSAADFLEKHGQSRSPEEAIRAHAHDGLNFAVRLAAGLVNDVFLANTAVAHHMLQRPGYSLEDSQAQQRKLKEHMADWWTDHLEAPLTHPLDVLFAYTKSKLDFANQSLHNPSLVRCLEKISVTGFDVLGTLAVQSVEHTKDKIYGWKQRAQRFGLRPDPNRRGQPHAVLIYDRKTDTFSVPDKTITFLVDARRKQNRDGLDGEARKTAGNLVNLAKENISNGCPVNRLAMGAAAEFAGKAVSKLIEVHGRYQRTGR